MRLTAAYVVFGATGEVVSFRRPGAVKNSEGRQTTQSKAVIVLTEGCRGWLSMKLTIWLRGRWSRRWRRPSLSSSIMASSSSASRSSGSETKSESNRSGILPHTTCSVFCLLLFSRFTRELHWHLRLCLRGVGRRP